jgi:hypothetical protein
MKIQTRATSPRMIQMLDMPDVKKEGNTMAMSRQQQLRGERAPAAYRCMADAGEGGGAADDGAVRLVSALSLQLLRMTVPLHDAQAQLRTRKRKRRQWLLSTAQAALQLLHTASSDCVSTWHEEKQRVRSEEGYAHPL